MWIKWKGGPWSDGLYKWDNGKVALVPNAQGKKYCAVGKAVPAKPPAWTMPAEVKKKRNRPSARRKIVNLGQQDKYSSLSELADQAFEE